MHGIGRLPGSPPTIPLHGGGGTACLPACLQVLLPPLLRGGPSSSAALDGASIAAAIAAAAEPLRRPCLRHIYLCLLEVALALRHLHAINLVHCDVKVGGEGGVACGLHVCTAACTAVLPCWDPAG